MKIAKLTTLITAASLITVLPEYAAGQEGNVRQIEEILVTARKISEDIQSVPISMTTFSGVDLENQTVKSMIDIHAQIPNLYLQESNQDPQAILLTIRGQKQNDTPPTVDPSVGIYLDNLYYPRSLGMAGPMLDLERAEVLRGPQGTLYGRNTTGGALSIYTKNPTDEFEGFVRGDLGNFKDRSVAAVVNIPINDTFSSRFALQKNERDGYGKDALGAERGFRDGEYFRGKLLAKFERVEAIFSGSYQDNDSGQSVWHLGGLAPANPDSGQPEGGTGALAVAAIEGLPFTPEGLSEAAELLKRYSHGNLSSRRSGGGFPNFSKFKNRVFGLDLKVDISDGLTLRSISGYQHLNRRTSTDNDSTPYDLLDLVFSTEGSYFSQELQLLGGDEDFNWVTGLYFGDENMDHYEEAGIIPVFAVPSPSISDADVHNRSLAVFGQLNWVFAEDWRLTFGARYSRDERSVVSNNRVGGVCVVPAPGVIVTGVPDDPLNGPGQCPRKFENNFSKPSWLLSIDHQLTEDLLVYVKASYGYRAGGLNLRGANFADTFEGFGPETVTEYEAGFKWDAIPGVFRLNTAAFYSDYEGAQRSIIIPGPSGSPIGLTTNAADAVIQGFELEAMIKPTERLTLNSAVGYINPEYKDFVDISGDRTGESFGVPDWTASANITYQHPTPAGELSAYIDYNWASEHIIDPTVPTKRQMQQKDFGLINARLALAAIKYNMDIAVYVKNLEDKTYLVSGSTLEEALGWNNVILGEPRTFGLSITYNF